MEEEFEEIEVEYAPLCDDNEIDSEYEFDAPRFYDFTQQETFWDASDAEQWFEFAPSYPPSPFLLKLRLRNSGAMESGNTGAAEEQEEIDDDDGRDSLNGKKKSLSNSRSSKDFSFMRPTVSHLAKQKNSSEVQAPQQFRRIQRKNSASSDCQLTKRQKLEAGYLCKIARLKHQILFTHKKTKEGDGRDVNLASKPNVTIPKLPNLATAQRAQRHKCRTNAESGGPTQSRSQVFTGRSLHKKILEGPSQSQVFPKIKPPKVTEFQEFHLRTSERAMQQKSNNVRGSLNRNSVSNSERNNLKRTNSSVASRQEKCRTNNKPQYSTDDKQLSSNGERGVFRNVKVFPLESNGKGSLKEPPTELFSKLSLASGDKQNIKSPSKKKPNSKELKENRPRSLLQEHEEIGH